MDYLWGDSSYYYYDYTNNTGADTFILADGNNIFYSSNGNSDYAYIYQFNPAYSTIQLQGGAGLYSLDTSSTYQAALYLNNSGSGDDELIAYLQGDYTGLSLTSSAFTYVPVNNSTIALSVAPGSVNEDGTTNLVYTFSRAGDLNGGLTVKFTLGGTATLDTDYSALGATLNGNNGVIAFAPGADTATLTVNPTADTDTEADETVEVTITPDTGYSVLTTDAVTGTILNDDALPSITLSVSPAVTNEDGTPNLIYTFTRTVINSSLPLTVNFSVGGTATFVTANDDYTQSGATTFSAGAGSITFAADSLTATLTIDPKTDTLVEADETVILTLADGNGYTIDTTGGVTGTITNDDGDAGNNLLTGGSGNDDLKGLGGNDTLIGLGDNDILNGGTGADSLIGGTGNDLYIIDDPGDVFGENQGEGTDTLQTPFTFSLINSNIENLTLTGSGNVDGTGDDGANIIKGNSGNNTLIANDGNDNLNGGAGNDTIWGGAGNDTVNGGLGADSLVGGAGNDSYTLDNAGDTVTEIAGEGTDSLSTPYTTNLIGSNIENLTLTGSGNVDGTGDDGANTIKGNSGNNTLIGNDGNDNLNGGAGDDTIWGGAGNDTVNGGLGADSLVGGAGNDSYTLDNAGDTVTEIAGEGTDKVQTPFSFVSYNIETITLTGTGTINATGDDGNETITGNSGDNILTGNGGNDNLSGGFGNDALIGGSGIDTLIGGAGDDILTGGAGNDSLTGGTGKDTFVFTSLNDKLDFIRDFSPVDDTIQLYSTGFANLPIGVLPDSALRKGAGATSATNSAHRLIYNTTNGALYFDADGSGGADGVQLATLGKNLNLSGANFVTV
ncbi:MAG: hypothetical protein N5P05_001242 [Chroococcopsis gigantea SAG 12.99]|nr:hypothetical protein [Chlorogloea purpurea SAG 13.99]MDV2999636.1 hypothetical protein [Chroococcopsis gigantea SAG 12.99]